MANLSTKQKLLLRMRRYARSAAGARLAGNIQSASRWDDEIEKVYRTAKREGFKEGAFVKAEEAGREGGGKLYRRAKRRSSSRDVSNTRSSRRKPSRTRSQYEASLRYNIKDAKEALTNAVAMSNWRGVEKYTKQIKGYERKLFDLETGARASAKRARRRETMGEQIKRRESQKRRKTRGLP